ncbi:MAG: ABC transporter ATP-binding protein/permease [Oscillospiraceae bacterium]|jgi:ABC-type bacteriocin/lantibiotic exporter with double-glycine peptidase domain|nr:ABC transporter ATP-binding protein/permease [Oscillospiraceae bacterium]
MPKNKGNLYKNAASYLQTLIIPHKKWYFISSALAFVYVGTGLLNAKATEWLVDSATQGNASAILLNAGFLALIILSNLIIAYVSGVSTSRLAAGATRDMKRSIANSLVNSDYQSMIDVKAGDALSTVNTDTQTVSGFLSGNLIGLFSQSVMALGAIIYLFCTNPMLMLISFAYTPIGMFLTFTINQKIQKRYPICADKAGEAISTIEQALMQVPVIKSFLIENQIHEKVKQSCGSLLSTEMEIAKWNALLQPACQSTSSIPRILFFIFAGMSVMQGSMTLGTFIAVLDLLAFIIGPSVYFPFMLNSLNKAVAAINRVKRLEDLPRAEKRADDEQYKSHIPSVNFSNLSFGYSGKMILSELSLSYSGAGVIAIKGRSGCGKTTLLDLIAGLLAPTKGTISISGNITAMQQDSFLFNGTVSENIRFGNLNATSDEVSSVMVRSGAENIDRQSDAKEGGGMLSGGQRQRVSLARTILSEADIWLLDEPTSALDEETERIVIDTIKRERTRRLIIISAHRRTLLDIADTVIDLDALGGENR